MLGSGNISSTPQSIPTVNAGVTRAVNPPTMQPQNTWQQPANDPNKMMIQTQQRQIIPAPTEGKCTLNLILLFIY